MDLTEKIKTLLESQKLAVLSTANDRQPYCSLIAFAWYAENKEIIFFTPKNTRKYRNLIGNNKVALIIDDRTNQSQDFSDATAVTLTGTAEEIDAGIQQPLVKAFITKHPDLAYLTGNNENAFFHVKITDYIAASFSGSIRVQF